MSRPPVWCTILWRRCLFGTSLLFAAGVFSPSSFEPSPLGSFSLTGQLQRTLVSAAGCTGALSPLKPELKKTHLDDLSASASQTDSQNAYDISSGPLISRKALKSRGWFTLIDLYHASQILNAYLCCRPTTWRHERAAGTGRSTCW